MPITATDRRWLCELTSLPTAAGREDRVIQWIEQWLARRRGVVCKRDRYGNLMLYRLGARSSRPLIIEAHMDHPAFVVSGRVSDTVVTADFRGGVEPRYFVGAKVTLHSDSPTAGRPLVGVVKSVQPQSRTRLDHRVVVEFARKVEAEAGDLLTWRLPASRIVGDRLKAPVCDDLAGVAAAVAAFERLGRAVADRKLDVRLLLTRAEELGFVGAIGAAKGRFIPKGATIVVLETSRSFADSPIGGGPIVRVADKENCFDPATTYMLSEVAKGMMTRQRSVRGFRGFRWQRKLMPGGTCNASTYQAYGCTAGCLCLALGNYHNMNETSGGIDREVISVSDWHNLVRLLVEVARVHCGGRTLIRVPSFTDQLDHIFKQRRHLLANDL